MADVAEDLPARIRKRMEVLHLNQLGAARKAGLGADYVRDILRGRLKEPSAEKLGKLAVALETTISYLMGQDEPPLIIRDGERVALESRPQDMELLDGPGPSGLLPIQYEVMGDTWREATAVAREPLGYEAGSLPRGYHGRSTWWELVRDSSASRFVPVGGLVQVVSINDHERHLVGEGNVVVVVKRMTTDDGRINLVQRSLRQVRQSGASGVWYTYSCDASNPTPTTAAELWLPNLQDYSDEELGALEERILFEAGRRGRAGEAAERDLAQMFRGKTLDQMKNLRAEMQAQQIQCVGLVIKALRPMTDAAGYGFLTSGF